NSIYRSAFIIHHCIHAPAARVQRFARAPDVNNANSAQRQHGCSRQRVTERRQIVAPGERSATSVTRGSRPQKNSKPAKRATEVGSLSHPLPRTVPTSYRKLSL